MPNIRWKLITIVAVLVVFAGVGVYPIVAARYGVHSPAWLMDRQLKLGLDLNGGVHLVLRVQTDDALKLETDTEMERLRAELAKANITFTPWRRPIPRVSGSRASRRPRTRRSGRPPTKCRRISIARRRRQRHLHVHDEAEHRSSAARRIRRAGAPDDRAPRQRTRRRRAEHRAAGRRRSDSACSCPASPTSIARRASSGRPASSS